MTRPEVLIFYTNVYIPHKALVLVDNSSSHPFEEEVITDPDFRMMSLPSNSIAVLQPMDQNLIQNTNTYHFT